MTPTLRTPNAPAEHGHVHVHAALLSSAAAVGFAWNQNRGADVRGGPIHWAKGAWLNLAVLTFLMLPLLWWRRSTAGTTMRRAMGTLGTSFALRGIGEVAMIYQTPPIWKCGYGIGHDAFAFGVLGAQLAHGRSDLQLERDGRAMSFAALAMGLLVAEGIFAREFRSVNDPASGIYFADDSEHFRRAIRMTKSVVFVAYPLLAWIAWRARRDFPRQR